MKTIKFFAIAILFFASSSIQSQVSVSVNIGSPPSWGPVGYSEVNYYYLPDIEAYYDIRASRFIFFNNGIWVHSRYLPRQYRNYNLYNGYKVVLNDYNGSTPYYYFKNHKSKYYKGYKKGPQRSIGMQHSNNGNHGENRNHGNYNNNDNHGNNGNQGKHNKGKGKD